MSEYERARTAVSVVPGSHPGRVSPTFRARKWVSLYPCVSLRVFGVSASRGLHGKVSEILPLSKESCSLYAYACVKAETPILNLVRLHLENGQTQLISGCSNLRHARKCYLTYYDCRQIPQCNGVYLIH